MSGTFKDMRNLEFAMSFIQKVAPMLRGTGAKVLSGLADVCFWTIVAKQHVNDILCFAVHRLLNGKNFTIFHLDAISFHNIVATLTIVASVVAFRYSMLRRFHREVRVRQEKLQVWRLSATWNENAIVHDQLHLVTFI